MKCRPAAVAERRAHPLPEEPLHRRHFDRAAALARDEEPACAPDPSRAAARDRPLVGGVEHEQLGMTRPRRRTPSRSTSAHRLLPPMPSRYTASTRSSRGRRAERDDAVEMRRHRRAPTSSHPRRVSIDLASALPGVAPQTAMSRAQIRDTARSCRSCRHSCARGARSRVSSSGRLTAAPASAG